MTPLPPPRCRIARSTAVLAGLLACAVLAAAPAAAQLVPAGGPFRLDDGVETPRGPARLLPRPGGGFLALWTEGEDSAITVRGRSFGAAGPLAAETGFGPGSFDDAAFATDGTLLLVGGGSVRRVALDGTPVAAPVEYDDGFVEPGSVRVDDHTALRTAALAPAPDGGFLVTWVIHLRFEDLFWPDTLDQLRARRFDATGVPLGSSWRVSEHNYVIYDPRLTEDGEGGWFLTALGWRRPEADFDHGIRRRIAADGTQRALPDAPAVWNLQAACAAGGRSLTVFTQTGWAWESSDGSCTGVFGMPADAAGDLFPQPVDLPRDTTDCQWNARVAALGDGFVAAWQTGRPDSWWSEPDASPFHGVSLRRFGLDGRPQGDPLDLRLAPFTGDDTTALLDDLATADGLAAVVAVAGGRVITRFAAPVPPGPCRPDQPMPGRPTPGHLCLGGPAGDRFRLDAAFLNPYANDAPGRGRAAPQTADTGAFWFFTPGNLELMVKVLDGRAVNGRHWVLAGAASTVEWWVTVTDTASGEQWGRAVPPFRQATLADVAVFPRPPGEPAPPAAAPRPPGLPGTAEEVTLGERYRLRVRWRDPRSGDRGIGRGVAVTADSALFWFFAPANLELMVKVLDGGPVNGHAWVLWASLTDVAFEIEVEDTLTAQVRTYRNEPHHLGGGADTLAFRAR